MRPGVGGPYCECGGKTHDWLYQKLLGHGPPDIPCPLEAQGGACNPRPVRLTPPEPDWYERLMQKLFPEGMPAVAGNVVQYEPRPVEPVEPESLTSPEIMARSITRRLLQPVEAPKPDTLAPVDPDSGKNLAARMGLIREK